MIPADVCSVLTKESKLEQVAQRGCGFSVTADTWDPSGHNPVLWVDPASAGSLNQMTHCDPFWPDPFSGSMIQTWFWEARTTYRNTDMWYLSIMLRTKGKATWIVWKIPSSEHKAMWDAEDVRAVPHYFYS